MPPKRSKRKTTAYINVRLSPDKDTDLIAWWQSLPPGQGGDLVKEALRLMLAQPAQTPVTRADLETLATWFTDTIGARLEALERQLAAGVTLSPNSTTDDQTAPEDPPRLEANEAARRLLNVQKQKW